MFKLEQIDRREHLPKPGQVCVDLGASPGAWSQYARRRVGRQGRVIASDILPMEPIAGVEFIQGEPERMTVAEKSILAARGLTGVRLSCQILCDHDMTVRAISRLAGSGRIDAGPRPADDIHPQPVTYTAR